MEHPKSNGYTNFWSLAAILELQASRHYRRLASGHGSAKLVFLTTFNPKTHISHTKREISKWLLMKDDLWWKRPTMEDDLKWKMTLNRRQHLFENNIQLKMFQDSTLPYLCDVIFMVDSDIVFNFFFKLSFCFHFFMPCSKL